MEIDAQLLLRKYISFSLGTWLNAAVAFFTTPITTWLISPGDFGRAAMFSTVYSIAHLVSLFGTTNAFLRFYPQRTEEERPYLLWSSLAIPLWIASLLSVLVFLFRDAVNAFLVGSVESNAHLILILALFAGIFQTYNVTLVRARGRGLLFSAIQAIQSLSNVGFVIAYALLVRRDFYAVLYAQLFSNLTALTFGLARERAYWFPARLNKELVKDVLKYSYPFVFSGLLFWILTWTDRFVLRLYVSFSEIGLYSSAFKLVVALNVFITGFSTFWYPFAYEQYERNPENKLLFSRVFDHVAFSMFTLGFLLLSFKDAIFLLLAKPYRPAAQIAPFLLIFPVMIPEGIVVARGIDFSKKTHWFIVSNGTAAAFNLVGNFLLIPHLGARGAALSTGASFIVVFLVEATVSQRLYPVPYRFKKFYLLLALFGISAFCHTFLQSEILAIASSVVGLFVALELYKKEFKNTFAVAVKTLKALLKR